MDHPMADHPLWEEQIRIEMGSLREGADKVRDRITELRESGRMANATPMQRLIDDWLPKIAHGVREWCGQMERQRGTKPIALEYLKAQDPYVVSLIALREVMDGIGTERVALVGLAAAIGRTVEHEVKIRLWEAQAPELFYAVKDGLDRNHSTGVHRRRVNVAKFGEYLNEGMFGFNWANWGRDVHRRVGIALLDVIIRYAPWFEVISEPVERFTPGLAPALMLTVKPEMSSWVAKALSRLEELSPVRKPTVVPPKPWTTGRDGGYWTPFCPSPRLVRFKASQESQQEFAADEYDAIDMPEVYAALKVLQETRWKINEDVLAVVRTCDALDQEIAGLPKSGEYEYPPRTARMEHHRLLQRQAKEKGWAKPIPDADTAEEIRAWKRAAGPIYALNAKRAARARSSDACIEMAEEFVGYEAIYFPHMLDFRGRLYPIPSFLHPQGDDLARGLLTFADGIPIDQDGADWLAVVLASYYGDDPKTGLDMDKQDYAARIAWAWAHGDLWLRIADNPVEMRAEWANADKPWQCLAAILEFAGYLREGPGYVSHFPCMVDGTCNGIQHLSALTRDSLSGALVNLVPADKPQDIYKFVAVNLQKVVERIERAGGPEAAKATYWLDLAGRQFSRKMTKRQVMVLPYGGSRTSFFEYTREWLDKADPIRRDFNCDADRKAYWQERGKALAFLVKHLWEEVSSTVSGGMAVMQWLQDCAGKVIEGDQPIFWKTPSGFTVRHFYGVVKTRCVDVLLDGERRQLSIAETTNKLSIVDQKRGIAPNFIHSLDAACSVLTINDLAAQGVTDFCTIHDAYGTHAANMWPLYNALRKAFVDVHTHDLLGAFRFSCLRVMVAAKVAAGMDPLEAHEKADEELPRPLKMGDLDLSLVLQSEYFFA